MVSFTINFEVMSTTHYFKVNCKTNHLAIIDIIDIVPYCRVGLQRRDTTPVKINDFKMNSPFDEVVYNQPAKLSTTVSFRDILNLF